MFTKNSIIIGIKISAVAIALWTIILATSSAQMTLFESGTTFSAGASAKTLLHVLKVQREMKQIVLAGKLVSWVK